MKIAFDLPEQVRSLSRFPIPVAIATILAVVLNLQAANLLHMSDAFESELIFACAGEFIASFAVHLWATGRNLSSSAQLGIALAAGRCQRARSVGWYSLSE
jgi:hypothetical protein